MPLRKFLNERKPETQQEPNVHPAQTDLDRPTADDIYEQVSRNARRELKRPALALAVSGVAGGMTMGLTPLGMSIVLAELRPEPATTLIAHLLYPIGFIAVILGRAQLFTENTLYPVALVLAEHRHIVKTARLWAIVLPSNILGAALFAVIMVRTGALRSDIATQLSQLGAEAVRSSPGHIFWSGVVGGWIIALVAWLVSGSHSITGSALMIWLLTLIVGLGNFAHCIASSGEILAAVFHGQIAATAFASWLWPAVLGNICGGVLLVTLLEYGQVKG